jgi:autotransporter-associated beta strand protein
VLAQRGSGTTTLTGTNTYSGDTVISGGTLAVGGAGVLGGGQYAGNVDLSSASGKLVIDTTRNQELSGVISGSGSLVKTSTGTLTVTGADNAYTGTTTVGGGTLVLNGTHTGGGAYTVQSGGTLKGDGRTTAAVTVDSGGNITPGNSPGELTIGDFTLNGTLNIAIDGAHNSLLTVVGNADITGGTVSFTTGAAATEDVYVFLTATGTLNSPFASINGLAPTDPLGAAGYQLFYDTTDGIAFLKLSSVTNVVEAIFSGPNAVIGSGTTNFNVYVYNGGATPLTASAVGDGVDSFGSIASTNIAANNGDELSNLTFSNGSGTFGTNTAVFNAVLNGTTNATTFDVVVYDHASNVVTGTNLNFRPVHAGAGIVTSTNSVTVSNKNDSFRIAMGVTNDNTNTGIAIDSANGLAQGDSADLFGTLDTSAVAPGRFTNTANLISFDDSDLNGASTNLGMVGLQITGYVYTGQGVWTGNGGDWQDFADWQEPGGTPGLDGALSVNDTAFFGAAGNGPVTLNTDAELLSVTFSNATTPYVLSGTGTLALTASGANPAAINTLAGGHTISNAVAPGSDLVLSNASGSSLTLAGAVSGVSGLVKTGAGTTTMTASNTYTGATSVAGGDLVVNGSIADSATTVLSGGTLSGTGTVGELTIENGGTVSPGFEGPGALNINGNVSLLGGGNYNWQVLDAVGSPGAQWDLLSVSGFLDLSSLTVGSEFNINLWSLQSAGPEVGGLAANFDNTQNYTWTILSASNGINGFSADKFNINLGPTNGTGGFINSLGGGTFTLVQNGNDLNLVFTAAGGAAVPEPGTWAAAALLAGGAAFMRWRRRRSVGDELED